MKDFDKLRTRLVQFGGWQQVWQYARMGVLWTGVKSLVSCAASGRSLKSAYPTITKQVDKILVRRYCHILGENKDWQELIEHVSIHKLNYRKAEEAKKNPKGYYNYIINTFQNDVSIKRFKYSWQQGGACLAA